MRRITITKIAVLFLIIHTTGFCSTNAQTISSKEIDNLVKRTMETFEVPGIAVAVIKDGAVIHAKGYGVRSLNSKEKVDEHTLFAIASNSKAFTAATIAILIDDGKLQWDDKVIGYIPEFRLYNSFVTEEFTIRDLLTHRSGLGLGAGDLMLFPDSTDFTLDDIIHNLRYLKAKSSFRSKYDYDNLLYMVAGEVVSRVSKMSWEDFVEKRIMIPLEMNRSAASFSRLKDKSNVIDAHAPVDGKIKVIDRHRMKVGESPAGGIYSSIHDMSKWIIMQLNQGGYGKNCEKQLFSKRMQEEMWSPQTILPRTFLSLERRKTYNTNFLAYGLGWFLMDVKGLKKVSHTGGLAGVVTKVSLIPELSLGIIVFTNQQSGAAFKAIAFTIINRYLGMEDEDLVKRYYVDVKKKEESAKKITEEIWNEITEQQKDAKSEEVGLYLYTGTYEDNWFGEIVISKQEDKLWFDSKRSPRLTGELLFYKGNTFIVKWNDRSMDADAFVLFELDNTGQPSGIKMKAISPLTDFSFDFHDLDFHKVEE